MAKIIQAYRFSVENRPGALATVAELIAKEGINLDGCMGLVSQGKGEIYAHTNNPQATQKVLQAAGIQFEKRELFEVSMNDKPGELAKVARALADAQVNLTHFYLTMKQTLVLGVDHAAAAKQVFQQLGL